MCDCVALVVQRCRCARKAMVDSSAPIRTVFQQAGAVMVMLIVTIHQMKPAAVRLSLLIVLLFNIDGLIISFCEEYTKL